MTAKDLLDSLREIDFCFNFGPEEEKEALVLINKAFREAPAIPSYGGIPMFQNKESQPDCTNNCQCVDDTVLPELDGGVESLDEC